MSETTFTFRVDDQLKGAFAQAAKANDRTGAQLLRDYMREFVQRQQQAADHDAWFRQQVQIGLDAANAGDLLSADDVEAEAERWREAIRQDLA
jgi:predicted transcriptional regulator